MTHRMFCLFILLLRMENLSAMYWNWTETGDNFNLKVPVLYGLRIPSFLKDIKPCNTSCQVQHFTDLTGFYLSTNGPGWSKRKHWGQQSIFYCDWEGVLCYNRTKHVIAIKLEGNNGMLGYVSGTLGNLPYLLGVNFGGSELADNVAELLATFKPCFIRFDFAYNKLTGYFPATIARDKPRLGKIQLSGNTLVRGSLPADIYLLEDLQVLSLGETGMQGSIPSLIGRLSNLYFLDMELLGMSGDLNLLKGLSNLSYIHLMSNELTGQIPEDFGNWFPKLVELNLQGNQLHGAIPSSIGKLKTLKLLNLSNNKRLSGKIPLSFSNMVSLEILAISLTSITGFEKGLVLNSTHLNSFVATGSPFSCSIYELIAALYPSRVSLIQMNVQNCDIYGKFDKINDDTNMINGIFSFSRLTFLNLGGNKGLTGTIPDPISSLGLLMYLNVSHTNLTGPLPVSYLTKLAVLQQIDIRGNMFMQGEIERSYMTIDYSVTKKEALSDHYTCPDIRLLHNNGLIIADSSYYDRKYCSCDANYYGQGGYCKKCMSGGYCAGMKRHKFANHTINDTYLETSMKLRKGYWPFPKHDNVQKILKCPWTRPGSEICNPFGRVFCYVSRKNKRLLTTCGDVEEICLDGAYDRLCSKCKEGYYKDGLLCEKCPKKMTTGKQIIVVIVATLMLACMIVSVALFAGNIKISAIVLTILQAVAIFILAAIGILPSWISQLNILLLLLAIGGLGKFSKGFLKIAVFYVQVADAMISTSHIWPDSVYKTQQLISSVISLRFSALGCLWPSLFTPIGQIVFMMLLPLCVAAGLWIVYLVWYLIKGRKDEQASRMSRYRCGHLCIVFLNLAYFSLVRASTSALVPCMMVENSSFMAKYAWIDCNSSEFITLRRIAYAAIPLYVIGAPILFFFLLHWNKSDIKDEKEEVKLWLGSLFVVYQSDYRVYMEVLLMIRRLAVALLLTFFAENILLQTTTVCIVLAVYLAFESHAKPFAPVKPESSNILTRYGLENIIEIAVLVILLVSFITVQSARVSESNKYVLDGLVWGIVVINIVLILLLLSGLIKRMVEKDNIDYNLVVVGVQPVPVIAPNEDSSDSSSSCDSSMDSLLSQE